MESFSFEFGRIFHEAVFVEWFACLWARTDTTHDAPLLVTLVILNRHWVVKVQTICQGLQCNIRKTLMMAYCRDNGNYRIIHQHNLQVSLLWFHYKTRMHSSRMHTARSRSRRGGGSPPGTPRTRHTLARPGTPTPGTRHTPQARQAEETQTWYSGTLSYQYWSKLQTCKYAFAVPISTGSGGSQKGSSSFGIFSSKSQSRNFWYRS